MLWNLLFGLCILGLNKYGDYISYECPQAGYACAKICDVDHKHYPRKECEDAKGKRNIWKKSWKTKEKEVWKKNDSTKEEVLIKGYKDAETKQESKSDTTTVQSVKQFHKEAVGTDKPEGL